MLRYEDRRLEVQVTISSQNCVEYFNRIHHWEREFDEHFASPELL